MCKACACSHRKMWQEGSRFMGMGKGGVVAGITVMRKRWKGIASTGLLAKKTKTRNKRMLYAQTQVQRSGWQASAVRSAPE